MESLYLDCGMGVAGDTFVAALLELHSSPDDFIKRFNRIGLLGTKIQHEEVTRYGITGTYIRALCNGVDIRENSQIDGETLTPIDIKKLVESLPLSQKTLDNINDILNLIFEAERAVHQLLLEEMYSSQFNLMEMLVDITGACMLLEELAFDRILASPIHVGNGKIRYKSRFFPIPSPATAQLLRGVPHYQGNVFGELCTPTGAALMRHFVDDFVPFPNMKISKVGYGIGATDFKLSSCLRAMCGKSY